MNSFFKLAIYSSVFLCSISNGFAQLNESTRINTAIDLIKVACATGEKLDIEVSGNGGVSFIKRGVSGKFNFTKEEINGVIKGTNQNLAKEENQNIRICMQQYVPAILEKLLEPTSPSATIRRDSNYYLKEQKIPVDIPISILDGKPLLTVTKIYEYIRRKMVDISIEIPYRSPYRFNLINSNSTNSSRHLSGQFEYRDTIYKITVSHINLQEQFAIVTLVKYKDTNKR
ncbi:MAG: hypothetical protein D3915_05255 [Candidatus Electrothrix sp. AU1_5]|nr:hypothetical protein [Candidatus Electrothrix gigas]